MPKNSSHLPGDGFLGWMGRQIGHVKKALQTDVTATADAKKQQESDKQPANGQSSSSEASDNSRVAAKKSEAVIYRNDKVEELPHPQQPNMKLRRTTIDEVIVTPQSPGQDEKSA